MLTTIFCLLWLTGAAQAATTVQLSCSSASMTGSGTDACRVTLSAASGRSSTVRLSSSSAAVQVPRSVSISSGSTSASFTANVSAVTSAQNVTLTAQLGRNATTTFALQLEPAAAALTLSSSKVNFGDVAQNTTATQSVTLTSSGTAALTISAGSISGSGFGMTGVNFPVTLNPGQSATLDLSFDPSATGAAAGAVTLTSNASSGSTAAIQLSGTGTSSSYAVDLSWEAPSAGGDAVSGYNIFRSTGSSSSYQQLNASVNSSTSYADSSVQSGTTYNYYVESVDASGNASSPSNVYTVTIP